MRILGAFFLALSNSDKVSEIANDIRINGFDKSKPIIVTEAYIIVDGHSRFMAAKKAGLVKVLVIIKKFDSRDETIEYEYKIQLNSRRLTDGEYFAAFLKLDEIRRSNPNSKGSSDEAIGRQLNKSARQVCKMREIAKKAFSSRHNDRDFDSNPEHIAKDKSDKNVIWSWCGTDISFDKGELKYYEETFGAQLEQTNQNYIKSRHKERVVTMDEWRKKTMHAPEEQILQIGRMEQYPEVEVSLSCFEEYLMWLNKWNEEHGKPFFILNWAMHQDEMGAPHFHLRRAWPCKDEETGLTTSNQTQTLLKAGILPPDPEKKISKKNNPKMTFDKMCREKWIFIARSHGLEIEDTPKPQDEVGKTLEEFQKEKDL